MTSPSNKARLRCSLNRWSMTLTKAQRLYSRGIRRGQDRALLELAAKMLISPRAIMVEIVTRNSCPKQQVLALNSRVAGRFRDRRKIKKL